MSFMLVLMFCMALMGYGISQIHEMQKDYANLQEKYELNTLVRIKQIARIEAQQQPKEGIIE